MHVESAGPFLLGRTRELVIYLCWQIDKRFALNGKVTHTPWITARRALLIFISVRIICTYIRAAYQDMRAIK